ncbi:MAG: aldo/keto reductase, partial [Victivallaceae bacterium]
FSLKEKTMCNCNVMKSISYPVSVTLGRTNLQANKNGFGALPIQRISNHEAVKLLHKAFDNGINFYDTARYYTDSEVKLGAAFGNGSTRHRADIIIASKTGAANVDDFWRDLHTTLGNLQTEYLDIYQFHNPPHSPKPDDGSGLYEAMLQAQAQGKIRFIGLTNHRLPVALEAVKSGLYATLQFPFSYLSTLDEVELIRLCQEKSVGFIAMKALAGGLINDARLAYAFMAEYTNVLPIWGIQRKRELDEFIACQADNIQLTSSMLAQINIDKKILSGEFCRGCGYCLPCPAGIEIPTCARMSLLLRRAPQQEFISETGQAKMAKISECKHCGHCVKKCPYHLDTPKLLQKNYEDYLTFLK